MPNEVDQDRMEARTKDLNVVNIDDYRANGARDLNTSKAFIAPKTSNLLAFFITIALILFVSIFLGRMAR